jgi:hypothetical protein
MPPTLAQSDCRKSAHVSHCLAGLWQKMDDERRHYTYWYFRWNSEWASYGDPEHLSLPDQQRQAEIKARLLAHPWVTTIVEEDGLSGT